MFVTDNPGKRIIAFIVSLALFMDSLDATIINTAIPAMARSLQVNPVDLKIALISYLLSLAIFIPISGWVADKFGIKRVFITALLVFTASSFWCGWASSLPELVMARSAQGLGGSLMLPIGRLIILRTFERHQLVDAMNQVIIVVSLGVMLGPVAGGFITDHFSWHWIFWVNIPVGLLAALMALRYLHASAPRMVPPFDMIGFILFGGGLAMLTFALSDFSESTANQHVATVIMLAAILMLLIYGIHSRRRPHPIVNIDLFRLRTFQTSVLGNLLTRLGFGGVPFLLPLLLQIGLGYSAQLSGLLLVPIAVGILLVKPLSLYVLRYLGYKRLLMFNTILVSVAIWSFQLVNSGTPIYVITLLTFAYGFLMSLQFSGMNSLAYSDIAADDLSAATSIVSTTQQLSQSFGVAVGALLLRYYSSTVSPAFLLTPTVFHHVFLAVGFITLLSTLLFLRLRPEDGHQMLTVPTA